MIRRDLLTGHWAPYLERALTLKPCYEGGTNGGEVLFIFSIWNYSGCNIVASSLVILRNFCSRQLHVKWSMNVLKISWWQCIVFDFCVDLMATLFQLFQKRKRKEKNLHGSFYHVIWSFPYFMFSLWWSLRLLRWETLILTCAYAFCSTLFI